MIKGVITGDLVNSTNIAAKWRQTVVDALHVCVEESIPLTPVKLEMYRGDSFQVVVDKPEYALAIAIALRAKLKAETPDGQKLWDARLAVGVGEISFESDNIVTSDDFNTNIELVTRFADDLITSWTAKQARVVYQSMLFPKLQKDLAEELDMTRQNFNYHWSSARGQLILDYIEYFKSLISKYIR